MAAHELPVDQKATHAEVHYERPSPFVSKACGDCDHLVDALEPRCQTVASPIWLNGYCVRFRPI